MTVKKYLADIYGYRPGYQYNQLSQVFVSSTVLDPVSLIAQGAIKKIRVNFLDYFRPLPHPIVSFFVIFQYPSHIENI
jgi:hypothetical protein